MIKSKLREVMHLAYDVQHSGGRIGAQTLTSKHLF